MSNNAKQTRWRWRVWIFSRLGFYSIACANKPDGSLDPDSVMVRARKIEHLENLGGRFRALADAEIIKLRNRDYRYRLIVPKSVWVNVLGELAAEQTWSNFKSEAARNKAKCGEDYVRALHDIWEVMYRLQDQHGVRGRQQKGTRSSS